MMRILHLSYFDTKGGAARAAYRLHRSLLDFGIESRMLVNIKKSTDPSVFCDDGFWRKPLNVARRKINRIPLAFYPGRRRQLFSPSFLRFERIVEKIEQTAPDIVHLHWIAGMVADKNLALIQKPVVWTPHDAWAFTGGCHYFLGCENYRTQCGCCPLLGSKKENDLARRIFVRRQKIFAEMKNLHLIALSDWMAHAIGQSALLGDRPVHRLVNPLDTDIFSPMDKKAARAHWDFPPHAKIILFGATGGANNIYKGFDRLVQALGKIKTPALVAVFGSEKPASPPPFSQQAVYLGAIGNDADLKILYSAADVVVAPSLQETLPQVPIEAAACGTPSVAFSASGMCDAVAHKKTGYLAKPDNIDDLAFGIDWVLKPENHDILCQNARQNAVENFNHRTVARQYLKFYERLI